MKTLNKEYKNHTDNHKNDDNDQHICKDHHHSIASMMVRILTLLMIINIIKQTTSDVLRYSVEIKIASKK